LYKIISNIFLFETPQDQQTNLSGRKTFVMKHKKVESHASKQR